MDEATHLSEPPVAEPKGPARAAIGFTVAAAIVLYVYAGRGTTFFFDEWNFILDRMGWSADSLLTAHNGHLALVPLLLYKLYLSIFGLGGNVPFRLTLLALHLGCVGLLYVYLSRRLPQALALAGAALLLFLGSGWQNIIWPFQIGFLLSIASGLGMLLLLDRQDRRGDIGAGMLLAVSLASSGIGAAFLIGAIVHVIIGRDRWSRAWILAVPLVLYLIWTLAYGDSQVTKENLIDMPDYVANAIAGAFGGIAGLGSDWGRPLAVLAVIAVIVAIVRTNRLVAGCAVALAVAVSFWLLTGASRATLAEPESPRYVYVGALLLILVAAEFLRGIRPTRIALVCVWLLVGFSILANLGELRNGARGQREASHYVQAELTSLERAALAGPVSPGFQPDPARAPQIHAGPYLEAVERWGSPAFTEVELASQEQPVQAAARDVFARARKSGRSSR